MHVRNIPSLKLWLLHIFLNKQRKLPRNIQHSLLYNIHRQLRWTVIAFSARQNTDNYIIRYKCRTDVSLKIDCTNRNIYTCHCGLSTYKCKGNFKLQITWPVYGTENQTSLVLIHLMSEDSNKPVCTCNIWKRGLCTYFTFH